MRQKWRSEENVIFRGEERSDKKFKIERKKKMRLHLHRHLG
jgi:hypothetical protein